MTTTGTVQREAFAARPREDVIRDLEANRERTLALVCPVRDDDLAAQQDPIVSPLNWDLPHIGYFEQLWLVHALDGADAMEAARDQVLEAIDNERYERSEKELPDRHAAYAYLRRTRAATLERMAGLRPDADDPLLAGWFAHEMIVNHERQHQENMAMALQFIPEGRYRPPRRADPPPARETPSGMVVVPDGAFPLGAPKAPGTYDNEWPQHEVDVPAFEIDRAPVTNGEFLEFIDDGRYGSEEHWPEDSWDFVGGIGVRHPQYWSQNDDGDWFVRFFDQVRPLPIDEPVWGVSWFEAAAYADWAGKRLPTETEWEKAATWDPATATKRTYPWGEAWDPSRANLDFRLFATTPVGAYPEGASAVGCHQMVGDLWEWTATEFDAYPGFEAFPYQEYSEVFYQEGYKVLRGGSFCTHPDVARGTFRNWMYPHLRHVFAGFRCARDGEDAA